MRYPVFLGTLPALSCTSYFVTKERIMIAHRRTWFYRLAGQKFAKAITFKMPVTASKVREELKRTFDVPILEIWARG
jgi:hypothetical protein